MSLKSVLKKITFVILAAVVAVGCAGPPDKQQAQEASKAAGKETASADKAASEDALENVQKKIIEPSVFSVSEGANEKLYKNEGAHFELPFEFWYVTGTLETPDGPAEYAAHFHRVGDMYMHVRSGYNSLRLPGEGYDFRSFGMGAVQVLAQNSLKEMIEKYPGDDRYPEILAKLESGESGHFYKIPEDQRRMHRNELHIDLGGNRFVRVSETSFEYGLKINTWAGPLDLVLEATSDPIVFDMTAPLLVGDGELQGYSLPNVRAKGVLERDGEKIDVEGNAWIHHFWGKPDGTAMARFEIITQNLDNGGAFFIANFYDKNELQNSNTAYLQPDGTVAFDWQVGVEPRETYTSTVSRRKYNIGWMVDGDLRGRIVPLEEESEIMLEEGVGAFWLGPCAFEGDLEKAGESGVSGRGFCRVVGTEQK